MTDLSPWEWVIALWCALFILQIVAMFAIKRASVPVWVWVLSGLPGALFLVLFYSLVIHMYVSLGGWPKSIGEEGFPPSLLSHVQVVCHCAGVLGLVSLFVWPVVLLVCFFVSSLRRYIFYSGVYILSVAGAVALALLAPAPFWVWWVD